MHKISIAIAQTASVKDDIEANVTHHKKYAEAAADYGVQLIIFPELSLTGYEPESVKDFIVSIDDKRLIPLKRIARNSCMVIVVGAPILSPEGKLNIGALCLLPDNTVKVYAKQYLHPGEELHFSPGTKDCILKLADEKIALAICADISNPEHARKAAKAGATIYAVSLLLSYNGYEKDTQLLREYASEYKMTTLMSNHSKKTGGYVPAGRSAIWDETGRLVAELKGIEEAIIIAEKETNTWNCKTVIIDQ
jgi:predicted amidohydrolase